MYLFFEYRRLDIVAKKKETNTTTSSLEERVRNYGSEIVQLDDVVDQVRQTKDMYIGRVSENAAFLTMVREIVQNSFDEILKGNAFSMDVYVTYDERTHQVIVSDNGRGIPIGKINTIFGTLHTSSNYKKELFNYSAGKNGCGACITNCLSKKFTVDTFISVDKAARHAEFNDGHIWSKGEQKIKCEDRQGTVISFIPNEDVIGMVTLEWRQVYDLLALMVPSMPIKTRVEFTGIDKTGKQYIETIMNKDGILTYIINTVDNPLIEPIYVTNDDGVHKVELMFTYDTIKEEHVTALNNTCPTDGGKHIDGAIDGITRFFRDYMNKIALNTNNKNKLTCTVQDIRVGLQLAISSFCINAEYNGQAKEILSAPEDMKPFVSQAVMLALNEWVKTHPNELQKLVKYFKEVIEMRTKQDKERVNLSKMFESSALSGLPQKYLKPNSRQGVELIIVEGDSAFGSARNVRDHAHQGILPSKGKILNVFDNPREKVLKNEELAGVLQILDAGYGKSFNLEKCKVDRVIIMADADPDGAHIRTLWLRFFALYTPGLLEAGRVFAALPPLYAIPEGKGYRYFGNELDFIKFIQKEFSKSVTLKTTVKGKPMTNAEVTKLLYNNDGYIQELLRVSANHAIDPYLLETIMINRKQTLKKFKDSIKKKYRFLDVEKSGDTIVLSGIANEKYHKVFFNEMLMKESVNICRYLDNANEVYIMNDKPATLCDIMSKFEDFKPPRLLRFKGLGEMNPDMLGLSTLRPDGDRTLVQYTVEDVHKEIEEMRYINSNKDLLLKED